MPEKPELTEEEYRRRARRSLIVGGAASFAGYSGWRWIQNQPEVDNIPQVLRSGHELNESIWSSLFRDGHQARTFPRDSASVLRVNGTIGLRDEIDLDTWRLEVFGPDGAPLGTHTLDDVTALPRHEMTIEHKCIEGWAQITNWGGARFSDFMGSRPWLGREPSGSRKSPTRSTGSRSYTRTRLGPTMPLPVSATTLSGRKPGPSTRLSTLSMKPSLRSRCSTAPVRAGVA